MKKIDEIMPECHVETLMASVLLDAYPSHHKGCGSVSHTMGRKFQNRFAVGIIDNDKKQATYSKDAAIISQTQHLIVKKVSNKPHYFILVNPAMERFILEICNSGHSMSDYNLPSDLEQFKRLTKSSTIEKNYDLKKLFRDKSIENEELKSLKAVLIYLCDNPYTATEERIKEFLLGSI